MPSNVPGAITAEASATAASCLQFWNSGVLTGNQTCSDGYAGVSFGDNDDMRHLMMEWFREQGYIEYRRKKL